MRTPTIKRTRGLACGVVLTWTMAFSCLVPFDADAQQPPDGIPKAAAGPPLQPQPKPKTNVRTRARTTKRARGGLGIGGAPVAEIRKQVEKKNAQERPKLERRRETQYYKVAIARHVEQAVNDIRLTYQFLVDRHNRLEFNLGKLAIVALGEGSAAVVEWLREATQPPPVVPGRPVAANDPRLKNAGARIAGGAFDSATDRPSDVSALVMISPVASWQNVKTVERLKGLLSGSPLNVLAIGGKTDKESADVLTQLKPVVERASSRLSKAESLETGLHGARLLRFEPGFVDHLTRFLEQTVEFQDNEWEPRYNLTPVTYRVMDAVSKTAAQAEAGKAEEKAAPKPKAEEPAKAKAEAPKAEPKPAEPKAETPKPAEPKADAPKADPAKPQTEPKPAEPMAERPKSD